MQKISSYVLKELDINMKNSPRSLIVPSYDERYERKARDRAASNSSNFIQMHIKVIIMHIHWMEQVSASIKFGWIFFFQISQIRKKIGNMRQVN